MEWLEDDVVSASNLDSDEDIIDELRKIIKDYEAGKYK